MRRFVSLAVLSVAALMVAACQPPDRPRYPDISFDHLPPIELKVANIDVKTPYQEPVDPPHVGEQFPVSPSRAARRWADDRLRATGQSGTATVTIVESSATETELKRTEGLKGVFTKDQAQSYEIVIEVKVEAVDGDGLNRRSASARVTRKTSVAEDVSMNEREETWYKLTKEAMEQFNAALEGQIRKAMDSFVK